MVARALWRSEAPALSPIGKIYLGSSQDHPTFSPL